MFDLNNTKKYGSESERRLKKASIAVAGFILLLYLAFIALMLITKLGILSAFVHTKPVVNSVTVYNEPAYDCLDYDFYYKRFNWLYDGDDYKLFFVFDSDLKNTDENYIFNDESFSKFGLSSLFELNIDSNNENIKYYTIGTQENFSSQPDIPIISIVFVERMLETKESILILPSATTVITSFVIFMLVSAALKILSIAKSYYKGKLEFENGTLIVKLSCIIDIIGLIGLTYVFFFLCLWDIPIFYQITEPSLIYYFLFLLPIAGLSLLYTFLYTQAADHEGNFVLSEKKYKITKNDNKIHNPFKYKDRIIVGSGILYIVVGIVLFIIETISLSVLPYAGSTLIILDILIIAIHLFFGLNICFEKRWAVFTVRIFMILGIVVNLFLLVLYYVSYDSLDIGFFILTGFQALMIVLTSISIKHIDAKIKR